MGYFFTGILLLSSIIQTLAIQHYFYQMFTIGARLKTSLMGIIYKKVGDNYFLTNISSKDFKFNFRV